MSSLLDPGPPAFASTVRSRLAADFERFRDGLPPDVRAYCREAYGIDLEAEYAGRALPHPFGKASGQLSLNPGQARRDAEGGLAFVVLKTVIAESPGGVRRMEAWALPETRMRVDRITGEDGTPGWTVTWKGRGWYGTLEEYCRFFGEAAEVGAEAGIVVAPSVKYHLPGEGEAAFEESEYRHTTALLREVWQSRHGGPMPLEKDFSPTLAGDNRSREQARSLEWLRRVPDLIRGSAPEVTLGLKLMNARFDLAFQVEMLRAAVNAIGGPPAFLVYANRLFDPDREFEGVRGVACGGPDLSRRNLAALRLAVDELGSRALPPISATGNIVTGRIALEYALLGATSCQMHTIFQLPDRELAGRMRNKSAAVLHHLLFHPESGLLAWLLHLGDRLGRAVHWRDLPGLREDRPPRAGGTAEGPSPDR